jgi:hypothetical protein
MRPGLTPEVLGEPRICLYGEISIDARSSQYERSDRPEWTVVCRRPIDHEAASSLYR